ncbi:hypothetical protein MHU86_1881 [Fragilaria crotonensis]|nr:hypothetical protein MHU86_1881 [Fragilaria crotonensis]
MLPSSSKKTASKKLETLRFVGSSKFMKELQKTVFFAAYDSVIFSSGRSMTDREQKELLRASIIGCGEPDVMTLPQQMVAGVNQFSHLYDDVEIDINDDRNAASSASVVAGNTPSTRGNMVLPPLCDKKLKDCFFPQKSSGGKLAIFADKPDGITNAMLIAKNLSNPVHVSTDTIMRGAKEVLRNGRKALACAKDANSDYRDGTLPSGRTIADYYRYIRESMYQKLKGGTGASSIDDGDDDAFGTSDNEKEDCDESNVADTEMPEDYVFTGMIAFFLWGFIVESPEQEVYRSKQFQVNDSAREERALNSRKAVKKEAATVAPKERNGSIPLVESPFRRGVMLDQQKIEIAKLTAFSSSEERRSANDDYTSQLTHLQTEIDNRFELAKILKVSESDHPLVLEIQSLMAEKSVLAEEYKKTQI